MHKTIEMHFEDLNFKEAVKEILAYSSLANKYFQEQKPWELVKENPGKAREVICLCANICKNICVMMQPIMPNFSSDLQKQLNIDSITWKDLGFKLKDHNLGSAHILVNKIEDKPEFPLNLKVAEILEAKPHPDADKLLVMKIDLGLEKRQIVAGLKTHYLPEELIGKKVIVVSNLKPAKLRGELSQGMLLAADDGTKVRIIHPNAAPGTVLLLAGHKVMTEELTIDKFQKLNKLRLKDKKLTYEGLTLSDGAEIEIDMPDTSQVR
jgi:methionyl-tRNA synthetase